MSELAAARVGALTNLASQTDHAAENNVLRASLIHNCCIMAHSFNRTIIKIHVARSYKNIFSYYM
jgi:hypothetical protein